MPRACKIVLPVSSQIPHFQRSSLPEKYREVFPGCKYLSFGIVFFFFRFDPQRRPQCRRLITEPLPASLTYQSTEVSHRRRLATAFHLASVVHDTPPFSRRRTISRTRRRRRSNNRPIAFRYFTSDFHEVASSRLFILAPPSSRAHPPEVRESIADSGQRANSQRRP